MSSCVRRKNCINSQSAFCTWSAVCSLHFGPIQHFVPGLQSAFCFDQIGIAVFVWASFKSRLKYWGSKKIFSETILAAMIDVWTVWWGPLENQHNDRATITLDQLKINANVRLNNMAASDTLLRDHSVCWNEPATDP